MSQVPDFVLVGGQAPTENAFFDGPQGTPGPFLSRKLFVSVWTDTFNSSEPSQVTVYWGPGELSVVDLQPGERKAVESPIDGDQHGRVALTSGVGPVYGRAYIEIPRSEPA